MRPVDHYDAGLRALRRAERSTGLAEREANTLTAIAHALMGHLIHSELPDSDPTGFADWRNAARQAL